MRFIFKFDSLNTRFNLKINLTNNVQTAFILINNNIKMSQPQFHAQTCNGSIFNYQGKQFALISMMALSGLVLIFLLYKMFKLCSIAFSYSNFHIHQTYKLYALALTNIIIVIVARKTQLDLLNLLKAQEQQKQSQEQFIVTYDFIVKGYEIVNDIFGIISVFTSDYMHLFNSFTWLMVALNCDFTLNKQTRIGQQILQQIDEDSLVRDRKNIIRKRIRYAKNYIVYWIMPMLLLLSVVGTMNHKTGDNWCIMISISIVFASILPLFIFGAAMTMFTSKFSDPEVSSITKIGLLYLLITMIIRSLYFLVLMIKGSQIEFGGDALNIIYVITCGFGPIIVMSILSELQLKNQQYTLLRRSSGMIFRSTII